MAGDDENMLTLLTYFFSLTPKVWAEKKYIVRSSIVELPFFLDPPSTIARCSTVGGWQRLFFQSKWS